MKKRKKTAKKKEGKWDYLKVRRVKCARCCNCGGCRGRLF